MTYLVNDEIVEFFTHFKKNINNKDPFVDKAKCVNLYESVNKRVSNLNSESNETKTEILNNLNFDIDQAIKNYHFNISANLINQDLLLENLVSYFEKISKEINLITLVFDPVYSEIEINNVKKNYYISVLENIVLSNDEHIYITLFQYINKIRCEIFNKINMKDYNYNLNEKLPNNLKKILNAVNETLNILNELDIITNSIGCCMDNFNKRYINMLSNIYNVNANSIKSMDIKDKNNKFYQIIKLLTSETILHEEIFNDPSIFKDVLNHEVLKLNAEFIINIFEEKMDKINDHYEDVISKVLNNNIDINGFFSQIFDFNIGDFLDIYYKLYNFSSISIERICKNMANQINEIIIKKENPTLVYMFLSYQFLHILQEELMVNFEPSIIVPESHNENENEHVLLKLHKTFNEKIKEIDNDKIIEFLMAFSQTQISSKSTKEHAEMSKNITKINSKFNEDKIYETCRYLIYNIKNKDEFEDSFINNLCRKMITGNISRYNLNTLDSYLHEVSKLDNICLHINRKILSSYNEGNYLSSEFNTLFEGTLFEKNSNFLNLKLFPNGICKLQPNEYKSDIFHSKSFKEFLNDKKQNFASYFKSKYDTRVLYWGENMSTFDLEYKIGTLQVTFRVNYKQADIMFLIQNEYYNLFNKIKKFTDKKNFLDENNEDLKEFKRIDSLLKSNEFVKFMLNKKIMRLDTHQLNHLIRIELISFNNKNNIRKNKTFDFYKLKFKDDLKEVPKEKPPNKEKDIVFFRSDYVQCATVRICKHNKTIQEETLFDKVQEYVNNRFEIDRPLFVKSVEKLVNQEYIKKIVGDDNITRFEYIP